MSWQGVGTTNRQAWAEVLVESGRFDRVIYLETLGWSPLPRKREIDIGVYTKSHGRLVVAHAWNLLPWSGRPEARWRRGFNSWLTHLWLRLSGTIGRRSDLLVTFDPLSSSLVRRLGADLKLYDCLDLYREQPQYQAHQKSLDIAEKALSVHVDRVSVSSAGLASHFDREVTVAPGVPPQLPNAKRVRESGGERGTRKAIYVGALDEYKVDPRTFARLLELDETLQISVIGSSVPVEELPPLMRSILESPRVKYGGRIDRAALADQIGSADFGIVSMAPGHYSDGSFPLKYWDYVSCGKPVLSVNSRALESGAVGVVAAAAPMDITRAHLDALYAELEHAPELGTFADAYTPLTRVQRILDAAPVETRPPVGSSREN